MPKYKHQNICTCSDIEFVIKYECEEEFDEFFCPFCGIRLEDLSLNEDEDSYDE